MARHPVLAQLPRRLAHACAALPLRLEPRNPVFIVGCARSGTSILKRVIATHDDVVAFPGEANHLWHPTGYPWSESDHGKPPLWADPPALARLSLADWSADHGRRIQREFAVFQLFRGKRVFLNKSAMIAFMLREVRGLFPQARFVHIVRDGRAVALSYAHKEHAKMEASADTYRAHGYWYAFDDLLDRMAVVWQAHLEEIDRVVGEQGWRERGIYFECRYEDFCRRPRELVGEIVEFLGLPREQLRFRDDDRIRDMNYKFRSELSRERIRALSGIMAKGLERKGYPRDLESLER